MSAVRFCIFATTFLAFAPLVFAQIEDEDPFGDSTDTKAPTQVQSHPEASTNKSTNLNSERLYLEEPNPSEKGVDIPQSDSARRLDGTPEKVWSVLKRNIKGTWRFNEEPLDLAVERIRAAIGIPVILDEYSLNDLLATDELPKISSSLNAVTVNNVLNLILRQIDDQLTYTVKDGVILITTREYSSDNLQTKFYPVSDLVTFVDDKGKPFRDAEDLMTLIISTVQTDTWLEVGGEGRLDFFETTGIDILVVVQTEDVHEEITRLLTLLRELRNNEEYQKGPRVRRNDEHNYGDVTEGQF